jgi:hypothetical protein
MGVDISGGVGADRSVIVVRNRKQLLDIFVSDQHGVFDDAKQRLEPEVVNLARKWNVEPSRCIYDKANMGRNFGSYLSNYGYEGAIGYFGQGRGGRGYVNRRSANAFAIKRRLDPHRQGFVPFYVGGVPRWAELRHELSEVRESNNMELEEGYVKQAIEDKSELTSRLKRSSDFLDAFLMTFTFLD